MRNKRGFVFAIWIPFLVLLMCGIVVMHYLDKQPDVDASLVSPLAVLEVRDDLEIFEMRERELIKRSLGDFNGDVFKTSFVGGLTDSMKEFIFSDLLWEGKVVKWEDSTKITFLENKLYSVREDSGNLILERTLMGKKFLLSSKDDVDVSFPIEFEFEFNREYLIRRDGSVEVIV